MTAKTKQQLRAEAVERLKNSEYHTALDDICSMLGWGHEPHFEGATDALIDLLTDDANDDLAHESDVRTVSVDANDVKVSTMPLKMPSEIRWHYTDGGEYTQKLTGDSREKLEAAAGELTADYAASGEVCDSMYNGIIELLDRQAAITRRETLLENPLHNNPYVGLVRGKRWERKESSDYYCGKCGWKVTDHDSYCPECGGALHRAPNQPISQSDAPKSAETAENDASKDDIRDFDDSREKLEADVRKHYAYSTTTLMYPPSANKTTDMLRALPVDTVIGWLDRQAAITEREVEHDLMKAGRMAVEVERERIEELTAERDELQRELDIANAKLVGKPECEICDRATLLVEIEKLRGERDELQASVDYLESRHCDWADPDSLGDGCMLRKDEAFDALKAERDELKAKVEELTTEAEKARSQRHPFADLMIGALDSRGNELKLQERVEKLEAERDKAREESVELYSDLVKASDEREHYREKCSKMATIIHDALMVMDEGMA